MKTVSNYEFLQQEEMADIKGGMIIGPFILQPIGMKMGEWLINAFDDFRAGLLGQSVQ